MVEAIRPKLSLGEMRQVRWFFHKGQEGRKLFFTALKNGRTPQELIELRKNFDRGQSGQYAFETISSGLQCEAFEFNPNTGEKKRCTKRAECTVGFDVPGVNSYEIIPACSEGHACIVEEEVVKAAKDYADMRGDKLILPSFDRNGNTRLKHNSPE